MKPTILVVEDDELLRGATVRVLSPWYSVIECSCVREAMEFLTEEFPSIEAVVSDYDLDDGKGDSVLQSVGKVCPGATRILVSGGNPPDDAVAFAHHFLEKPYSVRAILDLLKGSEDSPRIER